MYRKTLCFALTVLLTACTAPPTLPPAPPPPVQPDAAVPDTEAPATDEITPADPSRMDAACRAAAARQLNAAPQAVSLSPAEETSLGFVIFGQASDNGGGQRSFECSFGPDGALRVVRAA